MKKALRLTISVLLIIGFLSINSFAQDKKTQNSLMKVSYSFKEIALILNVLDNIELYGDEVEAFIDVKQDFFNAFEELNKSNAKLETEKEFSMDISKVKNFLLFLQRGKIQGSNAEIFYSITQKTVDSAKKISN